MSEQILKQRYNSDFLDKAEERRARLNYSRISVGRVTNDRIQHVLDLLYQTHQCYYFGFFKAAINLGASLLEQSLIILFEELLYEMGEVKIKNFGKNETVTENSKFSAYTLSTLIFNANYYNIINDSNLPNMILLKHVRNITVHDMLPPFELACDKYKVVVDKKDKYNTIEIDKKEIDEKLLSTDSEEIYAYFVLSRTRELIKNIFGDRVRKYPPADV